MKKIYFISSLVIGFMFTGCDGSLLDTAPTNSVPSAVMWTTESIADCGVNGVYDALRYENTGYNLWHTDQDGFTGMNRNSSTLGSGIATASSALFSDYWQQNYEGITRANYAIQHLPDAPLTPAKYGRLMAECKFLRAWFYFNLNQVYKGVPYYNKPVTFDEVTKPRSTETAVWDSIISDLTYCINEPDFPNMYAAGNVDHGRVTKAAAYALRGKVYMCMKDYAKAEVDLRTVGTLGPTLFQGPYKQLFKEANEACPEMIFSVQNIGVEGYGSNSQLNLAPRSGFGWCWNNYLPNPDFVESFEEANGKPFDWNDYLPNYNSMTPVQRIVFFLRDNMTDAEKTVFIKYGADMTKYLSTGNEARVLKAFTDRDPRLLDDIITPYSSLFGADQNNVEKTCTLRWPFRTDTQAPWDIKTDTNTKWYYLWRKWVYEGASESPNRLYGPTDQVLIRYADVVLLLAEAINEQRGNDAEAITLVNSVRTRAGAVPLQTTDSNLPTFVTGQDNLRERIRNERRWELCNEGVNLFDEMRWGTWKAKKFYQGNGVKEIHGKLTSPYSWSGDYLYKWAIPASEVQRLGRDVLVPNDGWIY